MREYVSVVAPWKQWISFAEKDFDEAVSEIKKELKGMQSIPIVVKQRLLYAMMHSSCRDFSEEKALAEDIVKENPSIDNIKKLAEIFSEIDINKALHIAEFYYKFNYKYFEDILASLYAKQKNLEKLISVLNNRQSNTCNELHTTLEMVFQHSNNDGQFIEAVALALLLPKQSNVPLTEKVEEERKEISLQAVKWLNMTNMFTSADVIADMLLQTTTRASMPAFRPDRAFYFSPYLGYEKHRPLMITFNAMESDALVAHYQKYGLEDLEKLYGTKDFPCLHFFQSINKFNILHVLDEFQVWGQMNFSQYFLYIKNFISQMEPSHLIFFGASSAGFSSLLYGILFNADLIISPYPQTTAFHIYMYEVRKEMNRRFLFSLSPYCYINRIMKTNKNRTPKIIRYSSGNLQDKKQVENIKYIDQSVIVIPHDAGQEHSLFKTYGSKWFRETIVNDINTYCKL